MTFSESIKKAMAVGQFRFLFDANGNELGFYCWELRYVPEGLDIGITNMVIYKGNEGKYCFKKIITFLKSKYKNINSFIWLKRKTGQLKTFKQRKQHVHTSG